VPDRATSFESFIRGRVARPFFFFFCCCYARIRE